MDLTSAIGFQSNNSCNITCVVKTANKSGEAGFPPSGEREGGFTITHVTDASGNVVIEYSFDAWGRRRDKDDWSYTLTSDLPYLPTVVIPGMSGCPGLTFTI